MYGDHVLWAVDAACPKATRRRHLRDLRTTAACALAVADGLMKGPVHLNLPFRKPLEPEGEYRPVFGRTVATRMTEGDAPTRPRTRSTNWPRLMAAHERGVIICGPRCPVGTFPERWRNWPSAAATPIFADPSFRPAFRPAYSRHTDHRPLRNLSTAIRAGESRK